MATRHPVGVDDLFEIKKVNDPDLAPGGRNVACTVTSLDREGDLDDKYRQNFATPLASDGRA